MSAEEKGRRIREELSKEITELLRGVDSDNRYIREYSVQKLMEYRDPRARSVILGFLDDPREVVRVVVVQVLAALMPAPEGPARSSSSTGAAQKTGSLPGEKGGASSGGKQAGARLGENGSRKGTKAAGDPSPLASRKGTAMPKGATALDEEVARTTSLPLACGQLDLSGSTINARVAHHRYATRYARPLSRQSPRTFPH